jgi:isopenicillin-N N-acyltransferase-like protein
MSADRQSRPGVTPWRGRAFRAARLLLAAAALVLVAHEGIVVSTRIAPPAIVIDDAIPIDGPDGVRRLGKSYTTVRAGVREVYLEGSPEQIGAAHSRLLYDRMVANERELWGTFAKLVPVSLARTALMDASRLKFRSIDRGFPEARRREVGAEARAFSPDPNADELPTYHRMVFLHSLYDISLSFEHSPLIGCSAFGLGPTATADGHTLLARAFDLEAGDIFDRDKAVFFVRGEGVIPFASVSWPGLVGVMTGMNEEGVAVLVNGARAREPVTDGEPVVFGLREVLERAHDTKEAVEVLRQQRVMVSHLVFVADAAGQFAVVERAPGAAAFVRDAWADPDRVALTNHFEGPLRDDAKNLAVRERTTSLPRRARLEELLAKVQPGEATVASAVAMLRDHGCAGGVTCELGDRRSIDALIATHGVVADSTDRVLWVSAGPHLSGHFVRFDLRAVFADGHEPSKDPTPSVLPEDPILHDGRYEAGRLRVGGPRFGGDAPPVRLGDAPRPPGTQR